MMEGVLSDQPHAELQHEIDYDNTEFDVGKAPGDDFDFDLGDGNIVQGDHLETGIDNEIELMEHANGHDVDSYGESYQVTQEDTQGNDAEIKDDVGEHEIDYDHDDIGESLHVSAIDEEMGDSMAQEDQDVEDTNESYGGLDYDVGDDAEATGQDGSNSEAPHLGVQGSEDFQPGQETVDESDLQATDFPSVGEAHGEIGEVPQGGAERQEGLSPGHDATLIPQRGALDGNGQADENEHDADAVDPLPEGAQSSDVLDDEYDESAYSMEDGNAYNSQDFAAAQPDVTFCYRHDEYSLFAESPDDDPNTYFLADTEALNQPLCDFLTKIRGIIAGEVSPQDEIVLRVDGLGLEFGETTTREFLDRTTFGQIIDLHDRLVKLDDAAASRNLYVYLITRPNCLNRFGELTSGATDGKGLSSFERYFDAPSPADDALGNESHGASPEGEALGDSINDSHSIAADNAGEDDNVEQLIEETVTVDIEQIDSEHGNTEFTGNGVEEVTQVTHTEFLEGDGYPEAPDHSEAEIQQTEIEDEFLQNLDEQGHEEVLAESGIDSNWAKREGIDFNHPEDHHANGEAQENEVIDAAQEEELFDYDDNEEFDEQVEVQDANQGGEAPSDPHDNESLTIPQSNDESSHAQHEIDYAAAEDLLETEAPVEVNTTPSRLPDTLEIPLDVAQSGTPPPVSDNTSASNTLNGEEIDFDDDVMAAPAVTDAITDAPHSFDSGVDEIDWDHDEDEILDGNETNLSSNSAKRSRQLDTEAGLDDENAVKRRRT